MQRFIVDCWNSVMDHRFNPLSEIPDMAVRHLVMQILAWMWCIIFAFYVGSWIAFGVSAILHILLIVGVCITVVTFDAAKKAKFTGGLGRGPGGEHE